jgi:hypothetical protein
MFELYYMHFFEQRIEIFFLHNYRYIHTLHTYELFNDR